MSSRNLEPRVFQLSPVSNNSTWECVYTSTAEPRPASRTLMCAVLRSGIRDVANTNGNAAQTAVTRSGQGQRKNSTTPAANARGNHQSGGMTCHNDNAPSAAHTSAGQKQS